MALAVATAGRSSRYADGLAPPPKFFGLLASKMEHVTDAGQQQKETKILEAFEKYAATGSGWTALPNVDDPNRKRDDKME